MSEEKCPTAVSQLDAMKRGERSSTDLVNASLQRIGECNPTLNAVITLAEERALAEAEAWDRAYLDERSLPPLAGLPVLIKDNQRTEGIRTTLGSARHLDTIPQHDAGIVRRLRAAGAIVVGKTNIPEYSIGANTVNPVFGATGNPFDPAMTCGGSSGGSAVAVAADMVKLATGSDHGGSLRIPACYCGVVGFRATPGVVPNEERRTPSTHYSLQGPIAQTVEDAALMLSVIADRAHGGSQDPMAFPLDARQFRRLEEVDPRELSVAVSADLGGLLVSKETQALFETRMSALARHLGRVEASDLDLTDAPDVDWHIRQDVFVSQYFEEADQWGEDFNQNVRQTFDAAKRTSMQAIAEARHRQLEIIRRCDDLFSRFDVLLVPGVGVQPFPWSMNYPETVDGEVIANYMGWLHLTSSLTVAGLPVVTLPMGLDERGLPFGIQVVGRRYHDHRLLSIARTLERICAQEEGLSRPIPVLAP